MRDRRLPLGTVVGRDVYVNVPLPEPAAGVNVIHGWSDDAVQAHPADVVILMVPVAPEAGADMAAAGLREIAQDPVTVESTDSIRLRTSPKSPTPRIFSRPVKRRALSHGEA